MLVPLQFAAILTLAAGGGSPIRPVPSAKSVADGWFVPSPPARDLPHRQVPPTKKAATLAPALPAFTSTEFQDQVRAVETNLSAGDFAAARSAAEWLPKRVFGLSFDDRKAPPSRRSDFRSACAKAMRDWGEDPAIDSKTPDIRISFEPTLATDAELGGPANLFEFFSDAPGHPRLAVAIGLRRGDPERDATADDIYNDVRFAIGSYLGLGRHSFPGFVMDASAPTDYVRRLWPVERKAALAALNLAEYLRRAVASRTVVAVSGSPHAILSPARFAGDAIQGDRMAIPIQMTNSGTGTLVVDAIGDCACVVPESAPDLGPGAHGVIQVRLDTKEYTGAIDRKVIVLTNDPEQPIYISTIHVDISPRYRILMPQGQTWVFGEGGLSGDAYVTFPNGADMKVIDARITGIDGARVTCEPWTGSLADPEMRQPAVPRHGFRLHVALPDKVPPGRSSVELSLFTNDLEFSSISQTIFIQRGIVALPEELNLNEIGSRPRTAVVLLSRPGHPFAVRSVTSDLKSFQVTATPGEALGVVKLQIKYDGRAPKGEVNGEITILTDDPKQPRVRVRILASVQ